MTPEETLYAALIGDAAVSALVGTRVFADFIEKDTVRPALVYQRAETKPEIDIHGSQFGAYVEILVVMHAENRATADTLAAAVTAALAAVNFWQTTQSAGFEPDIKANSVAAQYETFNAA